MRPACLRSAEEHEIIRRESEGPEGTDDRIESLMCETPVSLVRYQRDSVEPPKKDLLHLCRSQIPASDVLYQEWTLEPYGVNGRWGYKFDYDVSVLTLFQLGREGTDGTTSVRLDSADWGALRMIFTRDPLNPPREPPASSGVENKENVPPPPSKKARLTILPADKELESLRILSSAVWEAKNNHPGQWYFRATRRFPPPNQDAKKKKNKNKKGAGTTDLFVLESFNPDIGLVKTLLVIPYDAWCDKVEDVKNIVFRLFIGSRNWVESAVVRRSARA